MTQYSSNYMIKEPFSQITPINITLKNATVRKNEKQCLEFENL